MELGVSVVNYSFGEATHVDVANSGVDVSYYWLIDWLLQVWLIISVGRSIVTAFSLSVQRAITDLLSVRSVPLVCYWLIDVNQWNYYLFRSSCLSHVGNVYVHSHRRTWRTYADACDGRRFLPGTSSQYAVPRHTMPSSCCGCVKVSDCLDWSSP